MPLGPHADAAATEPRLEYWMTGRETRAEFGGAYWNTPGHEEGKQYSRPDTLRAFLDGQWADDFAAVRAMGGIAFGEVLDAAAGTCWGAALISREPAVRSVLAVDISEHRICEMAPRTFEMVAADTTKITRAVGSFYDIRRPAQSFDCIYLSQAFHHALEPERLMRELSRVLRPGGMVIVMGESPIWTGYELKVRLRNYVKSALWLLGRRRFGHPPVVAWWPAFRDLFPPDAVMGDCYLRPRDYRRLMTGNGLTWQSRRLRSGRMVGLGRDRSEMRLAPSAALQG